MGHQKGQLLTANAQLIQLVRLLGGDERRERVTVGVHQLDGAAKATHLVLRRDALGLPAALGKPDRDVGAVGILVGQLTNVDGVVDAELVGQSREPFAHPLAAVLGMDADRLRRNPAARRR